MYALYLTHYYKAKQNQNQSRSECRQSWGGPEVCANISYNAEEKPTKGVGRSTASALQASF